MLSNGKASHHQTTRQPTSPHGLHTRSRQVAKSSPVERIYRKPGERLRVSPPCHTEESGKPTAESRGSRTRRRDRALAPKPLRFSSKRKPQAKNTRRSRTSRFQTLSGDVKVVQQKLPRPGPQPVFNLEVHNEHVYVVGEDGVLVHDSCNERNDFLMANKGKFAGDDWLEQASLAYWSQKGLSVRSDLPQHLISDEFHSNNSVERIIEQTRLQR